MAEFTWAGVCLDCRDAEELSRFYGSVFGWIVVASDSPESRVGGAGWICMTGAPGGPTVSFQSERWYRPPVWPEAAGAQTKMMHFEVEVNDLDAAVLTVIEAGGSEASPQPADRDPGELRVMLDPAGHPFCLCLVAP